MRYSGLQVTFREIPKEIALSFLISGCPLRCPGCHSSDTWDSQRGLELDQSLLLEMIDQYLPDITCVLFLGGEWELQTLIIYLGLARRKGLKTALYSGLDLLQIPNRLIPHLDYLKVGPFKKELGGLASKTTNQRLYEISNGNTFKPIFLNKEVPL